MENSSKGFLNKLENFINEKTKVLEEKINGTVDNLSSQINFEGLMDGATDKLDGMMGSMNVDLNSYLDKLHNPSEKSSFNNDTNNNYEQQMKIDDTDMTNQEFKGYQGETVKMEVKPAIDIYPETILNKEFEDKSSTNQGVNLKKPGVTLKK